MNKRGRLIAVIAISATAIGASVTGAPRTEARDAAPKQADDFSPYVDDKGVITLPTDYKTKWVHLGDWSVAKNEGEKPHEFHEVYTQPGVIEAFQETGEFPDGAVLVKEVRNTQSEKLNTGFATWSGDVKIWFVMVKDKKNRFPESEVWGDGWGWALFEAKDPSKSTTTNYQRNCIGCHIPAEETDWIFMQGYVALKKK